MADRLLVVAAGGTGGHMFPAQALAEEMLARGWRVALSSDARGLRYADGFPEAVVRRETRAATPSRGGFMARLSAPLALLAGARDARRWFLQDRPTAVAGFGGYPSAPAVAAARALKIPRLLHEQNAVLGRANALFAAHADALALGVSPLANPPKGLEAKGVEIVPVGNPIRAAVRERLDRAYAPPAPDAPVSFLVFGGSQGAGVFASAVPAAIQTLPAPLRARLRVTQQARPEQEDAVRAAYAEAGVAAEVAPFFADLPERMTTAHLTLARAGASSVAELTALGRPSILAPYPQAAGDHQTANARSLASVGAAEIMPDAAMTAEALGARLAALLQDGERLTAMAAAARGLGRPNAAELLADLVEKIAGAQS